MDLPQLLANVERLKGVIKREFVDPANQSEPIYDGLFNPAQYALSSPRILWILKEPYCDGNERKGGGWTLTDDAKSDEISRWKSFQPICYINHGIWQKISDWDAMPWLRDCEPMRAGLKKVGFINVSKLPGLKTSTWGEIDAAYDKYKSVLLDQINSYAPNIIFACDPHANRLLREFGFSKERWVWFASATSGTAAAVQVTPTQRLVWVGHPVSRTGRKINVNDAISAATSPLQALS